MLNQNQSHNQPNSIETSRNIAHHELVNRTQSLHSHRHLRPKTGDNSLPAAHQMNATVSDNNTR